MLASYLSPKGQRWESDSPYSGMKALLFLSGPGGGSESEGGGNEVRWDCWWKALGLD